ncbi:ATP-binding protein [Desmospora profundinema]|uniref:Serine/threonine-protein kinase RsbT n=1 Tax=Desmospora profundinema TaxID=1571184 RepID=A0ABU1IPG1_9BACL|nr:ATP-binding protein [Desmospora profundinema]MDR6225839.1 serine/threonine-protein kinase RsbT [Desmospora profundinema]
MKRFPIKYEWDVVDIRSQVRELAKKHGFGDLDQARIVQSVSELAKNVVEHAEEGIVEVCLIQEEERSGIRIKVQDFGPGIEDLEMILRSSEAPASVEGFGLKQVRESMDDFSIRVLEGKGTLVQVTKWLEEQRQTDGSP